MQNHGSSKDGLGAAVPEWCRLTLSTINDGVISTGADGRVTFLNAAAEALTGWTDEQARTELLETVVDLIDHASRLRVSSPARSSLRNGSVIGYANHSIVVDRNGQEHAVHDSATDVLDDAGAFCGVVLVYRDISEQCRMERQLAEHVASMAALHEGKHEFLAVLSHKLRSPLGPIANAAHLMRVQSNDDPTTRDARLIIERQLARLSQLANDLLAVSQVGTGRLPLQRVRCDMRLVAERALTATAAQLERKGQTIEVNLPATPLLLEADPARMQEVIVNLVRNASNDTPFGGPLELTLERVGDDCVFRVHDCGVGIAPDVVDKVFDLFTKAERWMDTPDGGLGIGLAMANGLVTLHGGQVSVRSALGVGSEFTVRLPIVTRHRVGPPERLDGPC